MGKIVLWNGLFSVNLKKHKNMSKKSIVVRQEKRLNLVEKYKTVRKDIKEKIKRVEGLEEKINIHNKIQQLPRDSSKSRIFWLNLLEILRKNEKYKFEY